MKTIHIEMMAAANLIEPQKITGAVAVVIDVLRATSVMVTALANGAEKIIAVSSPEAAFSMRNNDPQLLLGGEKDAISVPGFDFDNSPFSYLPDLVNGKTLVMSTSNGTRAINGSLNADRLLIGCFLNAKAVVHELEKHKKVVLVCSGSNNAFTLEDSLCAGYMASLLSQNKNNAVTMSDQVLAMKELYEQNHQNLLPLASKGNHYQLLETKGFSKDLEYCFSCNLLSIVPEMKNGAISL
jgi:2-phosphosulfolactate phosphatase